MTDIGYARVSRDDQNLDLQLDAFKRLGIAEENIFTDKISGTKWSRKGLDEALAAMQPGDTLTVWKLDRVGRSSRQILDTVKRIQESGVRFVSLRENIDTTNAIGRFFLQVLAAIAELERDITVERTVAGLESARAKGHLGGKPGLDITSGKPAKGIQMYADGQDIQTICKELNVTRNTLYRWIRASQQVQQV